MAPLRGPFWGNRMLDAAADFDMEGRLVTDPRERGILRVRPIRGSDGRTAALRVRVETLAGIPLAEVRATATEIQIVEAPDPKAPPPGRLARFPGTIWFYAPGAEVGFLPDLHAAALSLPLAQERPRKGPPS